MSELAEEQDLRDMFERFGRVTRVFLAKDRDTGMAKGFAFISFQERTDAAKACEKMDGCKFAVDVRSKLRLLTPVTRWIQAPYSSCRVRQEDNLDNIARRVNHSSS